MPQQRPGPRPRPAWVRTVGAALSTVLVAGAATWTAPPASAAPADCPVVDFYVATSGATQLLNRYTIAGRLVSSLPLPAHVDQYDAITDIATNADGSVVYAAAEGSSDLVVLDTATGAVRRQRLTGPAYIERLNSLVALRDGRLLAAGGRRLFVIDPETGATSEDPRGLPAGQRFNGDLVVLADGDLLALTEPEDLPQPFVTLTRISPSGVVTTLGSVRRSYGLTTSHGAAYLPSIDGTVRRLDPVPTAAGTGPLPAVPLVGLGVQAVGAASTQDAGVCGRPTFGASVSQPSTVYGDPLQLIAYGLPHAPAGTVTFTSGSRTLCTAAATSPSTRCALDRPDAGSYPVTARWSATGVEAQTSFTVARAPGTFTAGLVHYYLTVGSPPELRAYRGADDVTGRVTLVAAGRVLCEVVRPAYTCTGPDDLPVGAYHVVATYSGDANHTSWVATTNFWVVDPQPTQVRATRPRPVETGHRITLRWSHLPAAARGPVTFLAHGHELCTATLPHRSCRAKVRLAAGRHRVLASYAGQDPYVGSTAATTLKVLPS